MTVFFFERFFFFGGGSVTKVTAPPRRKNQDRIEGRETIAKKVNNIKSNSYSLRN